jgi:hypothetical protein
VKNQKGAIAARNSNRAAYAPGRRMFEVSDETLVYQGSTSPLYARSFEAGEIWPGVVEKAFAQWRQGTTNDHPNLTVLNGGDPVWASAALADRSPQYFGHSGQTAASLRTLVKSHRASYRTFDPLTAWTYGTAPDGLSYEDAHIVGSHAYAVLGWTSGTVLARAFESLLARSTSAARSQLADSSFVLEPWFVLNRDYVVLRNPWGSTRARPAHATASSRCVTRASGARSTSTRTTASSRSTSIPTRSTSPGPASQSDRRDHAARRHPCRRARLSASPWRHHSSGSCR